MHASIESGVRTGYDDHKKKGSKLDLEVDTLGSLLAAHVTPADQQERTQVSKLAAAVQEATAENVEVAFVDQGYTEEEPAKDAAAHDFRQEVGKHTEARKSLSIPPNENHQRSHREQGIFCFATLCYLSGKFSISALNAETALVFTKPLLLWNRLMVKRALNSETPVL